MRPGRHTSFRSGSGGSSAAWLAWAWVAFIAYASLFPFVDWRWPAGMDWWEPGRLRWPRYFIPFDIASNVLGYLPLGLLVTIARLRRGVSPLQALWQATAVGAALSWGLEVLQHLLPPRVPSLLDWLLNTSGAFAGAVLAGLLQATGALGHWQRLRRRWLADGHAGALTWLMLWPAALLFPTPVPLGVGQVATSVNALLQDWLAEVPWASDAALWLADATVPSDALGLAGQHLAVALGQMAPLLVMYVVAHQASRRVWLAVMGMLLGAGATTLSTALNFGPDHALAWVTPATVSAMSAGFMVALALSWATPRLVAAMALMVLTGLVLLVNQAPTDPYFAQSLQGWEQGRFIRLHGVAQWLGRLWPYAVMAWLLARLSRSN